MTTATRKTREIIEARISGLTPDLDVRDFEVANIEKVMEEVEPEALREHPGDTEEARWARVQFYKAELLKRFADSVKPRLAAVFHQYVAATIRGGQLFRSYTIDSCGCVNPAA